MLKSLSVVLGQVPSRDVTSDPCSLVKSYAEASAVVTELHRQLAIISDRIVSDEQSTTPLSAVASFIELEARALGSRLELVKFDVDVLRSVVDGNESPTPLSDESLAALSRGRVPRRWCVSKSARRMGVIEWTSDLTGRASVLRGLLESARLGTPVVYELKSFERPDGFLNAVLRQTTRSQFRNLHSASLTIEVISE